MRNNTGQRNDTRQGIKILSSKKTRGTPHAAPPGSLLLRSKLYVTIQGLGISDFYGGIFTADIF